jgi:hypothetical protein
MRPYSRIFRADATIVGRLSATELEEVIAVGIV